MLMTCSSSWQRQSPTVTKLRQTFPKLLKLYRVTTDFSLTVLKILIRISEIYRQISVKIPPFQNITEYINSEQGLEPMLYETLNTIAGLFLKI